MFGCMAFWHIYIFWFSWSILNGLFRYPSWFKILPQYLSVSSITNAEHLAEHPGVLSLSLYVPGKCNVCYLFKLWIYRDTFSSVTGLVRLCIRLYCQWLMYLSDFLMISSLCCWLSSSTYWTHWRNVLSYQACGASQGLKMHKLCYRNSAVCGDLEELGCHLHVPCMSWKGDWSVWKVASPTAKLWKGFSIVETTHVRPERVYGFLCLLMVKKLLVSSF